MYLVMWFFFSFHMLDIRGEQKIKNWIVKKNRLKFLKKIGRFGFGFINLKPKKLNGTKTPEKQKKNWAKTESNQKNWARTKPNQKKPIQNKAKTEPNRFKPVFIQKNRIKLKIIPYWIQQQLIYLSVLIYVFFFWRKTCPFYFK